MNYKDIFKIALLLISSPARAWEEIRLQEDRRTVFTAFVYPMIGLCALSVFIGSLLSHGWGGPESFQIATTRCCIVAVSLFAGYFLAAYLINMLGVKAFELPDDTSLAQQFAGYAMVVSFLTNIVTGLLPDFAFIGWMIQFYTIYVIWEGVPRLLSVHESDRLKYTLICSILLILSPLVIQFVFNRLLLILN